MPNKVISSIEKKPTTSGDSTAVVIPAEWLRIANIDKDKDIVLDLSYSPKHDQHFIAIYPKSHSQSKKE